MDECQGCECSTKCYLDLLDYLWAHCATITNAELGKMLYGGPLETKLREWRVLQTKRTLDWASIQFALVDDYGGSDFSKIAEDYISTTERQNS